MGRYYQDVVEMLQADSETLERLWEEQKNPWFHDHAVICADAAYQLKQLRAARSTVEELASCPICGAKPWIYEDLQDHHIVCSEDCPAPRCEHFHPRDVSVSWNDWVRWYLAQELEG